MGHFYLCRLRLRLARGCTANWRRVHNNLLHARGRISRGEDRCAAKTCVTRQTKVYSLRPARECAKVRQSSFDCVPRLRRARTESLTGAAWHKTMFLRGAYPVHNPEKSAETGKLYWDVCWPSDFYPLVDEQGNGFSVAFIPDRLRRSRPARRQIRLPPANDVGISVGRHGAKVAGANCRARTSPTGKPRGW